MAIILHRLASAINLSARWNIPSVQHEELILPLHQWASPASRHFGDTVRVSYLDHSRGWRQPTDRYTGSGRSYRQRPTSR
jgi:hypothetical protein